MGYFIRQARLLDGSYRITAADNAHRLAVRNRMGYSKGTFGKAREFEYTHRAIPDYGARALDHPGIGCHRLGTNVENAPSIGHRTHRDHFRLGIGLKFISDDHVHG